LSCARTFEWFKKFKADRISVDDDTQSGRPSTSRNDDAEIFVRQLIRANRQLTVHESSAEVGISYDTCQAILTDDLNTRRVSAKFVPRVLTIEQKEHHLSFATDLLHEAETDGNFMEGIITGDETWVYGYDPETK
jgi:hypothetical protein